MKFNLKIIFISIFILIGLILLFFLIYLKTEHSTTISKSIFIYYTDKKYSYLVGELHTVKLDKDPIKNINNIFLTLKMPSKEENKTAIPDTLKIVNANLKDSILTLNLSLSKGIGIEQETLMIGAIVNTFTELPEIKQIKFNFIGNLELHLDYSNPFKREEWINLVKL